MCEAQTNIFLPSPIPSLTNFHFSDADEAFQSGSYSDSFKSKKSPANELGSGVEEDDDGIDDDVIDEDADDDGNEFVTINVSGKRYETRWNTLRSKCRSFLFSFFLPSLPSCFFLHYVGG